MNLLNSIPESAIDVIIALKDRAEVEKCVRSLLQVQTVAKVIICDGGSSDRYMIAILQALEQYERICIARFPDSGFNKARLLNQGILQATSEYILISDADILWNTSAIEAMLGCVMARSNILCHIQQVQESDSNSIALQRDRYTYQIHQNTTTAFVEVVPGKQQADYRPGCGLICARRNTLLKLGGFKELFQGWGWEDQDLLIRAELLGIQVSINGEVTHLSHTDEKRNRYHDHLQPQQTRDRNIVTCLKALADGNLLGDLPVEAVDQAYSKQVLIKLPHSLTC